MNVLFSTRIHLCALEFSRNIYRMINAATDTLIPLPELAKRFQVTYRTVTNWRKSGLECRKVGRTWYTTESALNRWTVDRSCQDVDTPKRESIDPDVMRRLREHGVRV